jgi:uncharacterized protein with NAD-binding domain and iron-sulfur cluster
LSMGKIKIAVLGGGIAALTAVWELTRDPAWRSKYEIVVYQLGFRLGGKCRGGRNLALADRVEEHGPHLLWGYYDNMARLMRDCYLELKERCLCRRGNPFASFEDAFIPAEDLAFGDIHDPGIEFTPYRLDFPENSARLGIDNRYSWLQRAEIAIAWLAWLARKLFQATQPSNRRHGWAMFVYTAVLLKAIVLEYRRIRQHGWEVLDDIDYRKWLHSHGAPEWLLQTALIKALYYWAEDAEIPAGTVLKAFIRSICHYRGRYVWRFAGGTGETLIAPLYLVLRDRGVKFQFFQRVDALHVARNEKGKFIDAITVACQATTIGEYHPLITTTNGIQAWPVEPVRSHEGRSQFTDPNLPADIDFESYHPIPGENNSTLRRGADFDLVLLGISVAALPVCCAELIALSRPFREMAENIDTVAAAGAQVWFKRSVHALGWKHNPFSLLAGYEPYADVPGKFIYNCFIDCTHHVASEAWQAPPSLCGYFLGTYNEQLDPEQQLRVFLDECFSTTLPDLYENGKVRWDLLADPHERYDRERIKAQYFTVPKNPSDRVVRAVAKTTKFRLEPGQSGFDNLVMCGDWVRTRLNIGGIENAVMSGLQAAVVLSNKINNTNEDQYARIVGAFQTRRRNPIMS